MSFNNKQQIHIIDNLNKLDEESGVRKETFNQACITDKKEWDKNIPKELEKIFCMESLENDPIIYENFTTLKKYFSKVYLFPFSWLYKWIKPDDDILSLTFMYIPRDISTNLELLMQSKTIEIENDWYRFLFQKYPRNFKTIFIGIDKSTKIVQETTKYVNFVKSIIRKKGY